MPQSSTHGFEAKAEGAIRPSTVTIHPELWSDACKPHIYTSFSAIMIAALLMVLCNGPLPAATEDSSASTPAAPVEKKKEPLHSLTPDRASKDREHDRICSSTTPGRAVANTTPADGNRPPGGKSKQCWPGKSQRSKPKSPSSEFLEEAKDIYLVLKSELAKTASVQASWSAMEAEGLKPNHKWGDALLELAPGQWVPYRLKAPPGGFTPGKYRVEVAVDKGPAQSLPFTVVPLLPPAARRTKMCRVASTSPLPRWAAVWWRPHRSSMRRRGRPQI